MPAVDWLREFFDVHYISSKQSSKEANPRISEEDVDPAGAQRHKKAARKGTASFDRVIHSGRML